MPKTRHAPAGFTLIELLVVASLTIMIMLAVTSIFMTFLVASHKANIQQKIKGEGERALSQIEFILRNSRRLSTSLDGATTCNNDPDSPMTNLAVEGLDGFKTTLHSHPSESPRVASHSSAINDYYYLTSEEVTLSNLEFICLTNDEENTHYINVAFDLKIGTGESEDRETAMEHFQTGVTLRNH